MGRIVSPVYVTFPEGRGSEACRLFCALLLCATAATAAVRRVELVDRSDVLEGAVFGAAGPYERIVAKAYFAVDPSNAADKIIADVDLAPRNEQGLVEFAADIYVLKPRDPKTGNGTALVEISNRGGKGLLAMFNFARQDLRVGARFFLARNGR